MTSRTLIIRDLLIIIASIVVAILLATTGVLVEFLSASQVARWLGSFVAGFFFTSALTTAPAIVALGEIAQTGSVLYTAFFGALGAVIGDLIIFRFFRDELSQHLSGLVRQSTALQRAKHVFQMKSLRWFTFLMGGLIIASPVPDELGVGLLGLARVKTRFLIPLSFAFNFAGIYAIGSVVRVAL